MSSIFLHDIRYGLRTLLRSPGFAAVAILSLGLGIGANTAVFSLVNALLLRPLPVHDPDSLVFLFRFGSDGRSLGNFSYPDYREIRDRNQALQGLAAYSLTSVSLTADESSELVSAAIVSGNYFEVLGVKPLVGRSFAPEEDRTPGTHPVVLLSWPAWQKRFGGDPEAIGKTVVLNGRSFTVIGVVPADFTGTDVGSPAPELWAPIMMQAVVRPPSGGALRRALGGGLDLLGQRAGWLSLVGRLHIGVSPAQAKASLTSLARGLARAPADLQIRAQPVGSGDPEFRRVANPVAGLLMAVVGLVLLIACANVANLLLARATARRREIGIRLVLGAGRFRLLRQLLTESLLLSSLGGAGGLLLGFWTSDLLQAVPSLVDLPIALGPLFDWRVLGFTAALSVVTGLLFGLAPALTATRHDLIPALKEGEEQRAGGGVAGSRLRSLLVVTQVALSLTLLIGSGLFLRSLANASAIDPGFDSSRALMVSFNLNLLGYSEAQGKIFYRQLIDRVESVRGVHSASLGRTVPLGASVRSYGVLLEGQDPSRDGSRPSVQGNVIGVRYFATMGIPILRGRDFSSLDSESSPRVVIINEQFARRFWPGREALGKRFTVSGPQEPFLEVIAVVRDGRYATLGEELRPFLYLPLSQNHEYGMTLHARTTGDPAGMIAAVRRQIQAIDPNLPVSGVRTMEEQLQASLMPARLAAGLLGVFAALALALAAVGLYGVMAYAVSRRTHEIGVRMALGAGHGDVLRLVLRHGMVLVGAGVALGLALALALTRFLTTFLYGISPTDPVSFAAVTAFLFAVALLATWLPARRAARTDPMVALRYE